MRRKLIFVIIFLLITSIGYAQCETVFSSYVISRAVTETNVPLQFIVSSTCSGVLTVISSPTVQTSPQNFTVSGNLNNQFNITINQSGNVSMQLQLTTGSGSNVSGSEIIEFVGPDYIDVAYPSSMGLKKDMHSLLKINLINPSSDVDIITSFRLDYDNTSLYLDTGPDENSIEILTSTQRQLEYYFLPLNLSETPTLSFYVGNKLAAQITTHQCFDNEILCGSMCYQGSACPAPSNGVGGGSGSGGGGGFPSPQPTQPVQPLPLEQQPEQSEKLPGQTVSDSLNKSADSRNDIELPVIDIHTDIWGPAIIVVIILLLIFAITRKHKKKIVYIRSGQVAIEYLLMTGFSLLVISALWFVATSNLESSQTNIDVETTKTALSQINDAIDRVSVQGPPAQVIIHPVFPDSLKGLTIGNESINATIILQGIEKNITVYPLTAISGNLSVYPGRHKIIIKALSNVVNLSDG